MSKIINTNKCSIMADKISYVRRNDDKLSFSVFLDNGSSINFGYDNEEECLSNYIKFIKRLEEDE